MQDIWILGAAGRSGRAAAAELAARQARLTLVGRDRASLEALAGTIGSAPEIFVTGSIAEMAAALGKAGPVTVLNFIGPFMRTALPIIRATQGHYVDIANELDAVLALFEAQDEAVAAGRCLVTGAGWGVLGTEGVVLKLCAGAPAAARSVRVDAIPFVGGSGKLGPTLAATIVEGIPYGGRQYKDGLLVRAGVGSAFEQLTLPDGTKAGTGSVPTGDLEAARRASGARDVVAASSFVPASPLVRAMMPALIGIFSFKPLRDFAARRIANIDVPPQKGPPRHSWGHAIVEFVDGSRREGWLRAGDGSDFTVKAAAEVAFRLANGQGRPGCYTPGALFGAELAELAGGEFLPG